jgi:hypothetical protein
MTPRLKTLMLLTDGGLLTYWLVTFLVAKGLIELPIDWFYSDYHNPAVVSWNLSFVPLDIILSVIGLASVRLAGLGDARWQPLMVLSLTMTSCAGLMAISFWAVRMEFDATWWAANLYLFLWPLPYLARIFRHANRAAV